MKLHAYIHTPSARVEFTEAELALLLELAGQHYDATVRRGVHDLACRRREWPGPHTLTFVELDLCAKALEGHPTRTIADSSQEAWRGLWSGLRAAMGGLRDRYKEEPVS